AARGRRAERPERERRLDPRHGELQQEDHRVGGDQKHRDRWHGWNVGARKLAPKRREAPAGYTPIAALIRARVSGSSRSRTPVASAMALAMAAAVGPCAASPVPRNGVPGRSITCTSTVSGISVKRAMG